MKKTVVYYFSGTGNSLVVAEKIKKRLDDVKLIEISSALELKKFKTKAKVVGFVFPCHNYSMPLPVKRFISKLELPKAKYIFGVVTRSDTEVKAFKSIDKILKKQDKKLNSTYVIDMPSNDPRPEGFKEPTYKDIEKIEKQINKTIGNIKSKVKNKEEYHDDTKISKKTAKKNNAKALAKARRVSANKSSSGRKKYFYATDDCINCGVCQKVCMSGKIEMEDGKPNWNNGEDCYSCHACINFCPVGAIQIHSKSYMKSYTKENGRYHHPHVTHKDLVYRKKSKEIN